MVGLNMTTNRPRGQAAAITAVLLVLAAMGAILFLSVESQRSMDDGLPDTGEISREPQGQAMDPAGDEPSAAEPELEQGRGATGLIITGTLLGIPIVVSAASLFARSRTGAIVTRSISVVVLLLWTLLFAFGGGIFLLPAVAAMGVSVILAASGDTEEPQQAGAPSS